MRPTTLKGLVHAGLAATAIVEAFGAKTRLRTLLLGAMSGFHAHATIYHFCYEPHQSSQNSSIGASPSDGNQPTRVSSYAEYRRSQ